jgi:hypothetical protein
MANIMRKEIDPSLLPVLARAQWNLAAHIMRRANGGDLISKTALRRFRFLAECTDSLVELQALTGGEIYIVSFYDTVNATHMDRHLIDWAVEFTAEDDPDNGEFKELRDTWPATEWKEWGR